MKIPWRCTQATHAIGWWHGACDVHYLHPNTTEIRRGFRVWGCKSVVKGSGVLGAIQGVIEVVAP